MNLCTIRDTPTCYREKAVECGGARLYSGGFAGTDILPLILIKLSETVIEITGQAAEAP